MPGVIFFYLILGHAHIMEHWWPNETCVWTNSVGPNPQAVVCVCVCVCVCGHQVPEHPAEERGGHHEPALGEDADSVERAGGAGRPAWARPQQDGCSPQGHG